MRAVDIAHGRSGDKGGTCDVGLVAFDDAPWARLTDPALTVVAQPTHEIGATAGHLLTERITGSARKRARHIVLSTELIVRESSLRHR